MTISISRFGQIAAQLPQPLQYSKSASKVFLAWPLMQASGQISKHILQAIQSFFKNFGLFSMRQEPVLLFLLAPGLQTNGPNMTSPLFPYSESSCRMRQNFEKILAAFMRQDRFKPLSSCELSCRMPAKFTKETLRRL